MKLAAAVAIYGGGPGSGCTGENCGRPKSSRDPSAIIFNNRVKRARKLAAILIKHNFGSSMARRMKDEHWAQVAKAAGFKEGDTPSDLTRRLTLGMLDRRWKVKAK